MLISSPLDFCWPHLSMKYTVTHAQKLPPGSRKKLFTIGENITATSQQAVDPGNTARWSSLTPPPPPETRGHQCSSAFFFLFLADGSLQTFIKFLARVNFAHVVSGYWDTKDITGNPDLPAWFMTLSRPFGELQPRTLPAFLGALLDALRTLGKAAHLKQQTKTWSWTLSATLLK